MGGYAGHIKHIYEANASVSDIVYLLDNIVWGNKAFTEKVDGLAMSAAVTNRGVRFARNKTQAKSGGLSAKELVAFFHNHPAEKTFLEGCSVISTIMKRHYRSFIRDKFYNFEIVDSSRCNVIDYNKSFVTMHRNYSGIEDTYPIGSEILAWNEGIGDRDIADCLKLIAKDSNPFPKRSQDWYYYHNTVQCFGGIADKYEKIIYDCLKYDLFNIASNNCLYDIVAERILDITKCSYHEAYQATCYVYGLNEEITGRDLLKINPALKILSSKEKSRVFLRDTFHDLHKKIQEIANFIFTLMPKSQVASDGGQLSTEGIVFEWREKLYKLTGSYQDINQTQGKFKDD